VEVLRRSTAFVEHTPCPVYAHRSTGLRSEAFQPRARVPLAAQRRRLVQSQ
jgi:hypothetical protein